MRLIVIIFLFFTSFFLSGQESSFPQPDKLDSNWWNKFSEKNENLEETAPNFIKSLNKAIESLSDENQEEAKILITQIEKQFKSWVEAAQSTPAYPPAPRSYKEIYSLDDLIKIFQQIRNGEKSTSEKKEEIAVLKNNTDTLLQKLDKTRQDYFSISSVNRQNKIVKGLEMIDLRTRYEISRKKLRLTEASLENETLTLHYLNEELEVAKKGLQSNQDEFESFERKHDEAKLAWDEARQTEQEIQPSTEELLDSYLKENDFIKSQILATISRLLNEPESIKLDIIDDQIKEWKLRLAQLEKDLSEQEKIAEKILHTSDEDILQAQNNILQIRKIKESIKENEFLLNILFDSSIVLRGQGAQWMRTFIDSIGSVWRGARDLFGKTLFYFGEKPITFLVILNFIMIMILTWWFSKLVARTLDTIVLKRKGIRKAVVYRLTRLLQYFILFLGFLIGLTWIGFDFSSFVLVAGALSVGIGFGLQSIFNDILSGIIILFQSHLKVGDFVELGPDFRGEIREINVRNTIITTNDGVDILVPNSQMLSQKVTNWTLRDPYKRVHVPFKVAYGTDIDEVVKLIAEAAKKVPTTLQKIGVRDPQVFITKLGDNGIELELVVWVDEKWTRRSLNANSQYLAVIEKTLKKHGIDIPYTHIDVKIKH